MRLTASARQAQIITALVQARQGILVAAQSLPDAARNQVFLGVWSVLDLLAHLIGWDYANVEGIEAIMGGRLPAFYAVHDHDWVTMNAQLVAQHRKGAFDEIVASAERSHALLIQAARAVPADEFLRDRGLRRRGWRVTVASILQAEASDEEKHHKQILQYVAGGRRDRES